MMIVRYFVGFNIKNNDARIIQYVNRLVYVRTIYYCFNSKWYGGHSQSQRNTGNRGLLVSRILLLLMCCVCYAYIHNAYNTERCTAA